MSIICVFFGSVFGFVVAATAWKLYAFTLWQAVRLYFAVTISLSAFLIGRGVAARRKRQREAKLFGYPTKKDTRYMLYQYAGGRSRFPEKPARYSMCPYQRKRATKYCQAAGNCSQKTRFACMDRLPALNQP